MQIILVFLFLVIAQPAAATTWYVKTSAAGGSDSNNCTAAQSPSTPKLTIAAAIACVPSGQGSGAGHTVEVWAGTYTVPLLYQSQFTPFPSGTSWSAPFTLQAKSGDTVTWRAASGDRNLQIASSYPSYAIVKNLIFDGTNVNSSVIVGDGTPHGASFIRFENNALINSKGIGFQISDLSSSLEFIGNAIHGGAFGAGGGGGGGGDFAYPMYISGSSHLIEGNKIYDFPSWGIHGYPNLRNSIIQKNEIYNFGTFNTGTGGAGDGRETGILVYGANNRINENKIYRGRGGIGLGDGASNTLLYNNTIYNMTGSTLNVGGIQGHASRTAKNNLLASIASGVELGSGGTLSNNLCPSAGTGCSVVESNPANIFIDPGAGNLALTASSPAIGAGTASIVSGVTACSNGAVDIGAHQTVKVSQAEVGTINSTTVVINFQNNCTPGILPASAVTGLTIQEDTGGGFASKTISGVTSTAGSNQVRAVVTVGFTGGSTARFSYSTSTGNITDSALIGTASNQRLNAVTNFSITNNVGGGGGATFTVVNLRAYEHSCGEVCSRVISSNLVKAGGFSVPLRGKFLLREGIKCTGGDCPVQTHAIWYGKNGAANTQVPTQTTGQEDLSVCPAPNVQNGQATTQQITTGTFVAGQVRTTGTGAPSVDLAVNQVTENVRSLCVGPNVVATDTFTIQIRDSGGTAITNTAVAVVATQSPSRAKLEIGCEGQFQEMAGGFECVPARASNPGDVEISMAPHLEKYLIRRKTDSSNAVRIEVPHSAVVRVNGAVQ